MKGEMLLRSVGVSIAGGLLVLSGPFAHSATESRSVQIGWGCIKLPGSYRVVQLREEFADQTHGYIAACGRPRVEWSYGFGEAQPLCHNGPCKPIWKHSESLGGRTREVGLMRDARSRAYF